MTDWHDRRRRGGRPVVDELLVRQLAGYATRFADECGHELTAVDVLAALNDTGLCFIQDGEGSAAHAHRWAVLLIAQDPLDQEPAIESHWDREAEGRERAAERRRSDTGRHLHGMED